MKNIRLLLPLLLFSLVITQRGTQAQETSPQTPAFGSVPSQAASGQAAAPSATSGQAAAPEQSGNPIRVLVEEVSVPFIVTDGRNHLVTNLTKNDFQVLEDKQPQEISSLTQESDVPLRIAVLLDTSASIRDRLDFEQKAAAEFFRTTLRPEKDKALLGTFDSVAELQQDFTDNVDQLISATQALRAGGGTALYDAIFFAVRDRLLLEAPLNSNFRRALIVMSDGEDNQSRFTKLQTLDEARHGETIIYAITTNIKGVRMPGDKILADFADETGGRYFQPENWEDLDDSFASITQELRSQYSLSYHPNTPRDGKYHEIEIRPLHGGLHVRARRGYFATLTPAPASPPVAGKSSGSTLER